MRTRSPGGTGLPVPLAFRRSDFVPATTGLGALGTGPKRARHGAARRAGVS